MEFLNVDKSITILYATTTGTARTYAQALQDLIAKIEISQNYFITCIDIKDYDEDNLEKENVIIYLCSTWINGSTPENMNRFKNHLDDLIHDFRVSKMMLSKVHFCVFGLGGQIYGENFCLAVNK